MKNLRIDFLGRPMRSGSVLVLLIVFPLVSMSFETTTSGTVFAMVEQGDGKVIIAGASTAVRFTGNSAKTNIARLTGAKPCDLVLDEDNFDAVISQVEAIIADTSNLNDEALNESAGNTIELPVGPDTALSMTGQDYASKFLLPNFYFHLTTVYDLLRMKGRADR